MAKTEQSSSRMDTVLKMLLIAFVSLLAFSSGVYFGKQMSDSDHQLKALESDFNTQSYAANEGEGAAAGEEAMGEEEIAALSDKYVNEEKAAERGVASATEHGTAHTDAHGAAAGHDDHAAPAAAAHGETHGNTHAAPITIKKVPAKAAAHGTAPDAHAATAHTEAAGHDDHAAPAKAATSHSTPHAASHSATSKPDLSAAHKAAERVANNAAPISAKPAAQVAESRIPTSLPKTVGANSAVEFTVQVASYPTADAAKAYADDLVAKGFPAFPVEATINGRKWFRVSVGSFKTMKDATTYRAQLLKQADVQNAIVQKITR